MIKRIVVFFLALQALVILITLWVFSSGSDGKLNWAQEAWRRMQDDHKQHCFDVIKESNVLAAPPSIRLLSGQQKGDTITIHYRINQANGRFQEHVYECHLVNGEIDKIKERKEMLKENFANIASELK